MGYISRNDPSTNRNDRVFIELANKRRIINESKIPNSVFRSKREHSILEGIRKLSR
jgi:hypothetical protein